MREEDLQNPYSPDTQVSLLLSLDLLPSAKEADTATPAPACTKLAA